MDEAVAEHGAHSLVLKAISNAIGPDQLITDQKELEYYSQDYYRRGITALAVARPTTVEELSKVVSLATEDGIAIFPRGGGFSYSDAYLPTSAGIVIDMQLLNQVVEINTQDMYVTVEAGCTWAQLEEALTKTETRPGFWGTLSGFNATVGGTASQNGASLGSAKFGISSESILAFDVVTADGSILSTGSAGQQDKKPFFRYYGPDMTGIFCGDAGALGIKARVTLRLEKRNKLHYGLSFGFETFEKMVAGMAAIAKEGRATEVMGFSAETMKNFGGLSFKETLKTAWAVAKASSGIFSGLVQLIKMGLAGSSFLDKTAYTVHCVIEAGNQKELGGQIKVVRDAVFAHGFDLPNTVPTVIRAEPFPPHDVLSPSGQRGLPVHTILPFSAVNQFHQDLNAYFESMREEMEKKGISAPEMYTTIGTTGFLYEPVFYWDDKADEFHLRHTNQGVLEKNLSRAKQEGGGELVEEMRLKIVDLMHQHGGIHMQVGKAYPFMRNRNSESSGLIRAIKRELDPKGLMNPGALGL